MIASASPPASAENPRPRTRIAPRNDADHNRRHPAEDIGGEANRTAQPITAKLGEVDACSDSEGDTNQAGDSQDQHRSHNRVCHAAARLSDGFGRLSKERPINRSHAAVNDVAKDRNQRSQHQQHGQNSHACHDTVGDATAPTDRLHWSLSRGGGHWLRHFPSLAGRGSQSIPITGPGHSR